MIGRKSLSLATLLVLSVACVTPSTGTTQASGSSAPVATKDSQTQSTVVCEYVKPSGSNIMQRECREVPRMGDDSAKKGSENWFRTPSPGVNSR